MTTAPDMDANAPAAWAHEQCGAVRRFLSDELLGTLGNVYKSAARLMSELTQRGADDCHGYWTRTQSGHPGLEQLLLDKVQVCMVLHVAAKRQLPASTDRIQMHTAADATVPVFCSPMYAGLRISLSEVLTC